MLPTCCAGLLSLCCRRGLASVQAIACRTPVLALALAPHHAGVLEVWASQLNNVVQQWMPGTTDSYGLVHVHLIQTTTFLEVFVGGRHKEAQQATWRWLLPACMEACMVAGADATLRSRRTVHTVCGAWPLRRFGLHAPSSGCQVHCGRQRCDRWFAGPQPGALLSRLLSAAADQAAGLHPPFEEEPPVLLRLVWHDLVAGEHP